MTAPEPVTRVIELSGAHRRKHFDFFNSMEQPHYSVCARMEIDPLLRWRETTGTSSLTVTMVYLIADAANRVPQLRQRIRGREVVEHETVYPSFTVDTESSDVFSFCSVPFDRPFENFNRLAEQRIDLMRTHPSFEDEPGRDDFLIMSAIPWVSFTAITHASHCPQTDSIPRITWGRHQRCCPASDVRKLPVSIQVHHALVDGRHVGEFFGILQESLLEPGKILG